jgi:ABC-type nitrate/sulfonate/bicarbonate transport system ATPase subunit
MHDGMLIRRASRPRRKQARRSPARSPTARVSCTWTSPFGALDHLTRELTQELLLGIREAEKKIVLFVTHDVDEAVFMGSCVVVMSARPGRIKRAAPIARLRHYSVTTTPAFSELKAEPTEQVRAEMRAAQAEVTASGW